MCVVEFTCFGTNRPVEFSRLGQISSSNGSASADLRTAASSSGESSKSENDASRGCEDGAGAGRGSEEGAESDGGGGRRKAEDADTDEDATDTEGPDDASFDWADDAADGTVSDTLTFFFFFVLGAASEDDGTGADIGITESRTSSEGVEVESVVTRASEDSGFAADDLLDFFFEGGAATGTASATMAESTPTAGSKVVDKACCVSSVAEVLIAFFFFKEVDTPAA
jgi:hypothetical protein